MRTLRFLLALSVGLASLLFTLLLGGCDNASYRKRTFGGWTYDDQPFEPLDPASFQPLGGHFARDARSGYWRGRVVPDSDGASFEVLSEHEARDRRSVWWLDTYRKAQEYWAWRHLRIEPIAGADAARYVSLGHGYGQDGQRAFFEGRPFPVRDVAGFKPIDVRFARDGQRGYFERREIPDSDGASFALVDPAEGQHVRDARLVWHAHIEIDDPDRGPYPLVRLLRGARPHSVKVLRQGYAVDGAQVWWRGLPLRGADGASFELVEGTSLEVDAQDAKRRYLRGKPVGAR